MSFASTIKVRSKGLAPAAMAALMAMLAPAFSAEPTPGASAPKAAQSSQPASPPAQPTQPTPPAPQTTQGSIVITPVPASDAKPDAKEELAKKAEGEKPSGDKIDAAAVPEKKQKPIAIILPIGSEKLAKVADAVKQGFIAGAVADGKDAPPYRIYPADDDGAALANAYRKAAKEDAIAVVGGVTRDGAAQMLRESSYLPTLALNAPPESATDLPDRFFYISLNLDSEARMAARSAFEEGQRRALILTTTTPLAKRIQESFEKEWLRLGGDIAQRIVYTGAQGEAERIRPMLEKYYDKESEKYRLDAIFLAADTAAARQVRPYLPASIPVFATSQTLDPRAGAVESLDLESVRFLEMPWFVERDHPAVMIYPRASDDMPIDYERLYALGIDAWRLARMIVKYEKVRDMPALDGVTGQLSLDDHQFVRKLSPVEMRDGRPQPYKPTERE